MKKVTLLAASVLAGLMSAQAANAAPAEFNGYMRSGAMQGKSVFGHKQYVQQLGRLGNENDTFGEMQISADIAKVDDTVFTVSTMFALGGNGKENNWDSNISNRQFYAEVKGLFDFDKDAKLWVGKKYVKREDSHVGDFYFYDVSGHGVGFENLTLGSGKLSASWTRKDNGTSVGTYSEQYKVVKADDVAKTKDDKGNAVVRTGDPYGDGKYATVKGEFADKTANVRVSVFDTRYEFSAWDGGSIELGATYLRADRDKNGAASAYTWEEGKDIKDAFNATVEIGQGFSAGWNKTVIQSFSGASADCAWSTTAELKGYGFTGQGYRILNMGETHFTDNLGMFHQLNLAYSTANSRGEKDAYKYDTKKTVSLVVRPYYKLTKMTKIVAELAAFAERSKFENGEHASQAGQKATLAYAISPDAGNFWSRPEIRFYTSYMNVTADTEKFGDIGGETGHDLVFGAQVEAWW